MAIGSIVFACLFGGVLLGMLLRQVLPEHDLSTESKDTMKLGTGLIATMGALVLGLLVGSGRSAYDWQKGGLAQLSASLALLDRGLAHYGAAAKDAREQLRRSATMMVEETWPEASSRPAQLGPSGASGEPLYGE